MKKKEKNRTGHQTTNQNATRLNHKQRYDKTRPTAAKRGYGYAWRKARAAYLRENPWCRFCLDQNKYNPANVVDHIQPHKGDMKLFWDRDNWQGLCFSCHNSVKQSQERMQKGQVSEGKPG